LGGVSDFEFPRLPLMDGGAILIGADLLEESGFFERIEEPEDDPLGVRGARNDIPETEDFVRIREGAKDIRGVGYRLDEVRITAIESCIHLDSSLLSASLFYRRG
jgi:hypothetical protein